MPLAYMSEGPILVEGQVSCEGLYAPGAGGQLELSAVGFHCWQSCGQQSLTQLPRTNEAVSPHTVLVPPPPFEILVDSGGIALHDASSPVVFPPIFPGVS